MGLVKKDIINGVAFLFLNRPEAYNSFNREMAFEFQKSLKACEADKRVRCIVVSGTGKAFCAGQDLKEVIDKENKLSFRTLLEEHYVPIIKILRALEKPVIGAVNGVAAGAGANIALACDIVLASENASFVQAFSKIGLIPDSAGTYFLPRYIGTQKALAFMMTGDKIDAIEAERLGMIFKVLPTEVFLEEVEKFAAKIAQMPTKALVLTKKLVNASARNNLTEQLSMETELQIAASETKDYVEGVTAFIEKRAPKFIGE